MPANGASEVELFNIGNPMTRAFDDLEFVANFESSLIREKSGTSDEEIVEKIGENLYLYCFVRLIDYQEEVSFGPSMLVHFCKHLSLERSTQVNQAVEQLMLSTAPETLERTLLSVCM